MRTVFVLAAVIIFYFTILPFLIPKWSIVNLCSLQMKEYCSVISSIFGIFFGTIGLFIGYFYYKNRKTFEAEMKEKDHRRKRLDILMDELNAYDHSVHQILSLSIRNEDELRQKRSEFAMHFERIESMLDEGLNLLNLSKDGMTEILRVNSYVDKCEILSHSPFSKLSLEVLYPIKDRYVELMKDARRRCYLCY